MDLTTKLRELYAPGVAYNIAIPDRPIPDMVLEVASRYPRRAAIDFFARQLTYAELAQEMRLAAGALHQAGVRPGDRVALVMPNCPQHAVAVLGTMLLGAVVVFFIPGVICPLCMMKTMRCHTVFQPFVRIMSVLVAGSGIGALVASWKKDAKPSA